MKAWICTGYGSSEHLLLVERPQPKPGKRGVLVRIHATTVSSADVRIRTMKLPRGFNFLGRLIFGISRPRQPILGTDFAGTVEAVGDLVSAFQVGDEVLGFLGAGMGCHAEYRVIDTRGLIVRKPPHLSFEEAVSLPFGGLTALDFLRRADAKKGESIAVIGASGAVGSAFVQIAAKAGLSVTGITSARNLSFVQSLGAEFALDYNAQPFCADPACYDIIADTVGASSFRACFHKLQKGGRYLSIAGELTEMFVRARDTKKSIAGPASERLEDLCKLAEFAQAGSWKFTIDRVYPFHDLPKAHSYVETGRKRGSVVVSVMEPPPPLSQNSR